ncbi:MAG: surface-adhesin E family protein [Smithellaceae bacterium]
MKKISSVVAFPLLVCLVLLSCENISYEWVKYHDDNDGNYFFYKKGKVDKGGGKHIVRVWGKEVYSAKGREVEIRSRAKDGLSSAGYDKLSYKKCLYEIDCSKQKISILAIIHYGADDEELYSGGTHQRNWYDIKPDSTSGHLQKEVCK